MSNTNGTTGNTIQPAHDGEYWDFVKSRARGGDEETAEHQATPKPGVEFVHMGADGKERPLSQEIVAVPVRFPGLCLMDTAEGKALWDCDPSREIYAKLNYSWLRLPDKLQQWFDLTPSRENLMSRARAFEVLFSLSLTVPQYNLAHHALMVVYDRLRSA